MQLLTFTLTGMDYGISLENVESIESKMNVVVVPTSPANIRGIIRLHGEILPVFSLIVMLDVKSLVSQEEQAAIRKMISDNTSDK